MNENRIIDAILTEDIDTFLFGAKTVLRRQLKSKNLSHVIEYDFGRLASHPKIGLSRGDFLLIALLCGGDYGVRQKHISPFVY